MQQNCGNCNAWGKDKTQAERQACGNALCGNEQSISFKMITVHTEGCQSWIPQDGQQKTLV